MNEKKQQFGWAMYDWANSAYVTTVAVAVLPIYFADAVVGKDGFAIGGRFFSATTLWAWIIGFAAFIIFLAADSDTPTAPTNSPGVATAIDITVLKPDSANFSAVDAPTPGNEVNS